MLVFLATDKTEVAETRQSLRNVDFLKSYTDPTLQDLMDAGLNRF